jgi:hypothetical protein
MVFRRVDLAAVSRHMLQVHIYYPCSPKPRVVIHEHFLLLQTRGSRETCKGTCKNLTLLYTVPHADLLEIDSS